MMYEATEDVSNHRRFSRAISIVESSQDGAIMLRRHISNRIVLIPTYYVTYEVRESWEIARKALCSYSPPGIWLECAHHEVV